MTKPNGYDEAQTFDGSFPQLEIGGHVYKIRAAEADETSNYNLCLRLFLDIAEGPQKDFFAKKYKNDKERREDAKWGCVFTQHSERKSLPFLNGMISSINISNTGYRFEDAFDEKTLRNKLVGGIFGREQYRKNNGDLARSTKWKQLRSVDTIHEGAPVPKDKYIDDNLYAERLPLDEVPF
ncbi:hypothetical protein DSECCO2_592280 [anaerobic digester metagenome]